MRQFFLFSGGTHALILFRLNDLVLSMTMILQRKINYVYNTSMKDIFGKALYTYWKGNHRTPYIIRRDDGYRDRGSLHCYFMRKLFSTEKNISSLAKGNILDVGCGAGRHVLYYQKKGFDIIGTDISPLAIKVCRERGCKKVRRMDIFDHDFSAEYFDTILLFGHNIGIGGSLQGAEKLLAVLRNIIKKDGVLLLTTTDVGETDSEIHKKYHEMNRSHGRYMGEIKIQIEYKDEIGDWFQWIHIDPKMLSKIAKRSGWSVDKVFREGEGRCSVVLKPV